MILDMLKEIVRPQNDGINVGINVGTNKKELSQEEKILLLLRNNPKMTALQLAANLNISKRQIERAIASLKSVGKLERIGATKNGYWNVTGR